MEDEELNNEEINYIFNYFLKNKEEFIQMSKDVDITLSDIVELKGPRLFYISIAKDIINCTGLGDKLNITMQEKRHFLKIHTNTMLVFNS